MWGRHRGGAGIMPPPPELTFKHYPEYTRNQRKKSPLANDLEQLKVGRSTGQEGGSLLGGPDNGSNHEVRRG